MVVTVGPFIGVSDTEAMIWFKANPDSSYKAEIKDSSGQPQQAAVQTAEDGIGIAKFKNLKPDQSYSYAIFAENGLDLLKDFENPGFTTFPPEGIDTELTFAFFSCHKPEFLDSPERVKPYTMQMWEELNKLCKSDTRISESEKPRFLLGIGDQIYADELWKGNKPRRRYRNMPVNALTDAYGQVYDEFYGLRLTQEVTARCPAFMTWDDHEIRDGWGSHGNEQEELQARMFQAASAAYMKYQLSYNPHLPAPDKRYYAFKYGKIGFVILDLRGYRYSKDKILFGEEQWEWLKAWLENEGTKCRIVFIACSVPFIHLTSHMVRSTGKWLGKIIARIAGISDDLVDQWNSEAFAEDARRFAEFLFDIANSKNIRFVLLGGDVHVGTFAVLRSYRVEDLFHPVIYQFTSSPISNKPTKCAKYLKRFAPEIELGPDVPFKGRLLRIVPERNFGLVKVRRHPETGSYGVIFEVHSQEEGIQRFATIW